MPTEAGQKSFKINTVIDGETYSQPLSVNIAKAPGIISGVTNTTLYLAIGIVGTLILIFSVLITRVSRRAKPQF